MSRTLADLASLVLTVVGVVFLCPECVYACSCPLTPGPERTLSSSDAVFSGKVATRMHPGTVTGTLRVYEVWKGPQRTTLEMNTQRGGWTCGYLFEEGQEYLVYASGKGEPYETSICARTKQLSNADKDLAILGNGEEPKDSGAALNDTSGIVGARAMLGIAGLAIVGSFLVVARLVRPS